MFSWPTNSTERNLDISFSLLAPHSMVRNKQNKELAETTLDLDKGPGELLEPTRNLFQITGLDCNLSDACSFRQSWELSNYFVTVNEFFYVLYGANRHPSEATRI